MHTNARQGRGTFSRLHYGFYLRTLAESRSYLVYFLYFLSVLSLPSPPSLRFSCTCKGPAEGGNEIRLAIP